MSYTDLIKENVRETYVSSLAARLVKKKGMSPDRAKEEAQKEWDAVGNKTVNFTFERFNETSPFLLDILSKDPNAYKGKSETCPTPGSSKVALSKAIENLQEDAVAIKKFEKDLEKKGGRRKFWKRKGGAKKRKGESKSDSGPEPDPGDTSAPPSDLEGMVGSIEGSAARLRAAAHEQLQAAQEDNVDPQTAIEQLLASYKAGGTSFNKLSELSREELEALEKAGVDEAQFKALMSKILIMWIMGSFLGWQLGVFDVVTEHTFVRFKRSATGLPSVQEAKCLTRDQLLDWPMITSIFSMVLVTDLISANPCNQVVIDSEHFYGAALFLLFGAVLSVTASVATSDLKLSEIVMLLNGKALKTVALMIAPLKSVRDVFMSSLPTFLGGPSDTCPNDPVVLAAPPPVQDALAQGQDASASAASSRRPRRSSAPNLRSSSPERLQRRLPQADVQRNVPEPSVGVQGDEDESDDDASVQEEEGDQGQGDVSGASSNEDSSSAEDTDDEDQGGGRRKRRQTRKRKRKNHKTRAKKRGRKGKSKKRKPSKKRRTRKKQRGGSPCPCASAKIGGKKKSKSKSKGKGKRKTKRSPKGKRRSTRKR